MISSSRLIDIQTLHISSDYIHGVRQSKDIIRCQIPAQCLFLHFISHLVRNHRNFPRPLLSLPSVIQDPHFPLYNTATLPTLRSLAHDFSNTCTLDFYTDGSLLYEGTLSAIMGFAWIQTNASAPQRQFAASANLGPSAYKAELLAILLAVQVAPPNCYINFFTVCQNILSHADQIDSGVF